MLVLVVINVVTFEQHKNAKLKTIRPLLVRSSQLYCNQIEMKNQSQTSLRQIVNEMSALAVYKLKYHYVIGGRFNIKLF